MLLRLNSIRRTTSHSGAPLTLIDLLAKLFIRYVAARDASSASINPVFRSTPR